MMAVSRDFNGSDFNDFFVFAAKKGRSTSAGERAVRARFNWCLENQHEIFGCSSADDEPLLADSAVEIAATLEINAPDFELPPVDSYAESGNLLISTVQPEIYYPIAAMGQLLGDAAAAIADVVQLPLAVAAQSVLAASAMVAQQFANVEIDGRIYPTSLFFTTVLDSGGRKSSADKIATEPLYRWQRALAEKYRLEMIQHRSELESYKARRSNVSKKAGRGRVDFDDDLADMESPQPPRKPYVFSQDPSIEGIHKGFMGGYPSQGLFTDEGGQFFGGYAMNKDNAIKTISALSKIWDGAPIFRLRAGDGESALLFNCRLTIHLMIQPIVADLVLCDPMLQQQGILARFLIASPSSIAGDRPYNNKNAADNPAISAYQSRLREMLETPPNLAEDGGLDLNVLQLDQDAKDLWIACYNEIESAQKQGSELASMRATASKMAENIARIAGVLAVIDGSPEITTKQMAGAIQLGQFYLSEQLRLARRSEVNREEMIAQELVEWISGKGGTVTIDALGKSGPRSVRKSVNRIREVMASLVVSGVCVVTQSNGRNQASEWRLTNV